MSANILKNIQILLNLDGNKSNNPGEFPPFKVMP